MTYKFSELRNKEVINTKTGERLGFVSDIELDAYSGRIISLYVPGGYRVLGLLGRTEDVCIKWEDIKRIGDDLIIIEPISHD